jgi:hypothetical protein
MKAGVRMLFHIEEGTTEPLVSIFQNLKEFKYELLLMSVLIPFCLIDGIKESFNIKVEKGYVLMRNLKDLVGTRDFLNRLELTFHQFYI